MSAPASPNESTPLLTHAVDSSTESSVNVSIENQGEPVSDTGLMQPIDKALLRMVTITLFIGILEFVMLCADFLIRQYCSTRFGTSSFWFLVSWPTYLLVNIFVTAFTAANIFVLRKKKRPFWPLPSVFVLAYFAVLLYVCVLNEVNTSSFYNPITCPDYLDNPDYGYPGTTDECRAIVTAVAIINWIHFGLAFVVANLLVALVVAFLIKVIKSWNQQPGQTRLQIPAGQFSIEVAVRWGQTNPQSRPAEA
ncbi:unnamed protein product [Clonostachys rhizophaga]|uniref:Uncharacterized protein n=1 Tax=Clonostachys rhizophaga TaxID=160324 RepID=A0A9N9VAC3_9HYPO|nr:unnamed protein product [Clonostachys rhizophaga]